MTKQREAQVQNAIRELRRRLTATQQELSNILGIANVTVAKWETSRPPTQKGLSQLLRLANEHGHDDLARLFMDNLVRDEKEQKSRRAARAQERFTTQYAQFSGRSIASSALSDLFSAEHLPGLADVCETIVDEMIRGLRLIDQGEKAGHYQFPGAGDEERQRRKIAVLKLEEFREDIKRRRKERK